MRVHLAKCRRPLPLLGYARARRRWQSLALLPRTASPEHTALMLLIVLLCLIIGVAVWLLCVQFLRQRRARAAIEQVSLHVQRSAQNTVRAKSIELPPEPPELVSLVSAVNQLLTRSPAAAERTAV